MKSYQVTVFLACDVEDAKRHIRRQCYRKGLCVTVTPTTFIYTGGEEVGCAVGFVNYPRFPSTPAKNRATAVKLAKGLMRYCCQRTALVVDHERTDWLASDPPALRRGRSSNELPKMTPGTAGDRTERREDVNISKTIEHEAYERGRTDYVQDRCENAPFSCIGGLTSRADPKRPKWIDAHDWPTYLLGYTEAAREDIGHEWATVAFGWSPAITLNADPSVTPTRAK